MTNKTKRPRKSKFDPHIERISELIDMGLTMREVAEKIEPLMDDVVDSGALYHFTLYRGLKCKKYAGGKGRGYKPPLCDGCKNCYTVRSIKDNSDVRVCTHTKRVIGQGVNTSPPWCHKREIT